MMSVPVSVRAGLIRSAVRALLASGARRAQKFVSEKEVVTASRRVYRRRNGKPYFSRDSVEIVVTIARPNQAARQFIKSCKRAGEPFPVRRARLTFAKTSRK